MLLVKKENKMIGYGKISDKDIIPFIDENDDKIYIIEVSITDDEVKGIKTLKRIGNNSEMGKIFQNLHLVCEEKNIYQTYKLETI